MYRSSREFCLVCLDFHSLVLWLSFMFCRTDASRFVVKWSRCSLEDSSRATDYFLHHFRPTSRKADFILLCSIVSMLKSRSTIPHTYTTLFFLFCLWVLFIFFLLTSLLFLHFFIPISFYFFCFLHNTSSFIPCHPFSSFLHMRQAKVSLYPFACALPTSVKKL